MYIPRHFEENRPEILQQAIADYPFGLLITTGASGLDANPLPFLHNAEQAEHGALHAHVARANPVWQEAADGMVLVVFQGPAAYVSPNWYPSKAQTGKVVPTWNYITVHARGRLRIRNEPGWLRAHVAALTMRHERSQSRPWQLDDAPADYIEKLVGSIVGLEISLHSMVGKWKLSQNRSVSDIEGVVRGLEALGDGSADALAAQMVSRR